MKALQRVMALIFAVSMVLSGCENNQLIGSVVLNKSSSAAETGSQTPAAIFPPAEMAMPGEIYLYRFFDSGKIYETEMLDYTGEGNLLAVIDHITGALDAAEPLPIIGITQQKGFVVIDFDKSLLDQFNKGELYELLTALVMTLRQNVLSIETVQFSLNGEVGVFGETFEPAPLAFAPGDPAEFAAILAAIPYEGILQHIAAMPVEPIDKTAEEISLFLSALGKIEQNAQSPAELNQDDLRLSCIWATAYYFSTPSESEPQCYRKELLPIADAVSAKLGMTEDMFWIAWHVRQTAKLLCGEEFLLPLEDYSKWRYFEREGVITPPHMGGGYNVLPFVLSYEATADGYRVEAAYIYEGMGGYFLWGDENGIPENQLVEAVQNRAPRREIILKRADDGGLRFVSHRFL